MVVTKHCMKHKYKTLCTDISRRNTTEDDKLLQLLDSSETPPKTYCDRFLSNHIIFLLSDWIRAVDHMLPPGVWRLETTKVTKGSLVRCGMLRYYSRRYGVVPV
jgi:hypothetical protein